MRLARAYPGGLGDCGLLSIPWLLGALALRSKFRVRAVVILRIITPDFLSESLIDATEVGFRVRLKRSRSLHLVAMYKPG